ncbi:cytochrome P450 [Conidiobolus coronatus NRRL 28638]|uniref:Cytochrome P450 n=1 Tax=Conidiobolus coronatus (strain ATCC 28846 / CBS 209.66 / NRRL 28638) TaxID=796925 RepID=A0A137NS30_CONC2|nr:cytochrome P450 [Conidiobolus coronatus NRRL 28638]|eukprot:KXN65547.1 cytochrome P450 [Conidiobolus coronatus NRRL 28638]
MDYPKNVQIPTNDQLKKMPFMDIVNKESMRIMTTSSEIQRLSYFDHTLSNGMTIPKNTPIFLHLWGVHHNPSAFPNPFEFNPNRFEDISNQESKNWQPFISGNRACIGSTFSLMEQRVTLAMLLQKFEFSISSDNPDYHKLRIGSLGIVRPKDLSIRVEIVKVPPELKNIPAVPLFTFFRLLLDKRCFRDKIDHYLQSYFNEFGVIRVFTHLGRMDCVYR